MEYKKGIYLLLFILFSFSITAINTWDSYQSDRWSTGLGPYGGGVLSFPQTAITISSGEEEPPLFYDLNNDDLTDELIVRDGSQTKIYNVASNGSTLLAGLVTGTWTDYVGMDINEDDFNDDGYAELIVLSNSSINVIQYNGTTESYEIIQSNSSFPNSNIPLTGVRCYNSSDLEGQYCVWGDSGNDIILYNLSSNGMTNYSIGQSMDMDESRQKNVPLWLLNWYGDGHEHILIGGESGTTHQLYVWDVTDKVLETDFDSDGIINSHSTAAYWQSSYAYVLPTARIIVGIREYGADDDGELTLIEKDGSKTTLQVCAGDVSCGVVGNVLQGDFVNDSRWEYCALANDDGSPSYHIKCWDINSEAVVFSWSGSTDIGLRRAQGSGGTNLVDGTSIGIKSTINENSKWNIVTPSKHIVLNDDNTITVNNITPSNTDTTYNVATGDLDGDSNPEVCGSKNGETFCSFSSFTNQPPVLGNYTFGRNYDNPVCVGTAVTWSIEECDETSDATGNTCHYTNDLTGDTERLVSTCGNGSTPVTGAYSTRSPTYSCTFNSIGTYDVPLYIQDQANTNDYTVLRSSTVYVINGTDNIDCNLPVSQEVLNGESTSTTTVTTGVQESDLIGGINLITGGSSFVKFLYVLIFSLLLIWSLAKFKVDQPLIYGGSLFVLWLICYFLGFMHYIWPILLGIVMVGSSIITKGFNSGGSGGD